MKFSNIYQHILSTLDSCKTTEQQGLVGDWVLNVSKQKRFTHQERHILESLALNIVMELQNEII
jgi:hypothetical protein